MTTAKVQRWIEVSDFLPLTEHIIIEGHYPTLVEAKHYHPPQCLRAFIEIDVIRRNGKWYKLVPIVNGRAS